MSQGLEQESAAPQRLTVVTIAGSALMAVGLCAIYFGFHSQLALAQAADSLFDMIGGAGLLWAVHHSRRPADKEHPQGHQQAQPVAALVVAVLAGVLAAEVLRSALSALLTAARPVIDWPVAGVFLSKVFFKLTIVGIAGRLLRRGRNSAISALRMDARNDVLVGSLAILGLVLDRLGLPRIDPLLSIGIALYIAYAGLRLGRENASLLLGESASVERQAELLARARQVEGVITAFSVLAVWRGARLHVQVTATVEPSLSLTAAHAIGHAVEKQLLQEADVGEAIVHIEPN